MGAIQPARFLTDLGHIAAGVRRVVTVPAPGAGNQWSVTVPAGVMWRVSAGTATYNADAVAGGRQVGLIVTVNGTRVWETIDTSSESASSTGLYNFASTNPTGPGSSGAFGGFLALPFAPLPQTSTITSFVSGGDAGDTWTSIALYVEEYWFTDNQLSTIETARERVQREVVEYELSHAQQGQ